jgi:hypothetical protein
MVGFELTIPQTTTAILTLCVIGLENENLLSCGLKSPKKQSSKLTEQSRSTIVKCLVIFTLNNFTSSTPLDLE